MSISPNPAFRLLKLKRQQASLQQSTDAVPVTVKLEDGSAYDHPGKLELTEVSVDEATGTVTLRAISRTRNMNCCRACMCAPM